MSYPLPMTPGSEPADAIPTDAIRVNESVEIPRGEIEVKTSRSSGAGGQHVNKTSSRVELSWNIALSKALDDEQRARLLSRLASRLSEEGAIRVVASDTRSQLRNREAAELRLAETIAKALIVQKKRKPTRKPRAANEARLSEKKKKSERKRERQRPITD